MVNLPYSLIRVFDLDQVHPRRRNRLHELAPHLQSDTLDAAIALLLAKNEELVTAFDRSVRRSLDLLNREVAARSTPEINGKGPLMQRIRSFFQFFAA